MPINSFCLVDKIYQNGVHGKVSTQGGDGDGNVGLT